MDKLVFYTLKGNKIIKVTVGPTGAFSEYIGTMSKNSLDVKRWKKEGKWVEASELKLKAKAHVAAQTPQEELGKK